MGNFTKISWKRANEVSARVVDDDITRKSHRRASRSMESFLLLESLNGNKAFRFINARYERLPRGARGTRGIFLFIMHDHFNRCFNASSSVKVEPNLKARVIFEICTTRRVKFKCFGRVLRMKKFPLLTKRLWSASRALFPHTNCSVMETSSWEHEAKLRFLAFNSLRHPKAFSIQ